MALGSIEHSFGLAQSMGRVERRLAACIVSTVSTWSHEHRAVRIKPVSRDSALPPQPVSPAAELAGKCGARGNWRARETSDSP